MLNRRTVVVALMIVCLGGLAIAQDEDLPLSNWGAPPYWTPAVAPQAERGVGGGMLARAQGMTAQAEALPSSPLPFVAIAPCRIVDTRVVTSDGFHQPNFADDETRTFNFSASPDCPGLPATAGAYSLNVQFRPLAQLAFLTAYPSGITRPGVSTLSAGPAAWVQNAAVVPAGTGGAIDVYCQFAGRVVIDVNGYYGPQSVVTSLNTLTRDVTLLPGANIAITPGANTLTVAMTGVPGGTLPTGAWGQTLYSNGVGWLATSNLYNNGTNVGIGTTSPAYQLDVNGMMNMPSTAATGGNPTAGVLFLGGTPFIHTYSPPGSEGSNTFIGQLAGNFTATSPSHTWEGSYNTAVGANSLPANTTGWTNAAIGAESLLSNTTGFANTVCGYGGLYFNTGGSGNTAIGMDSLAASTGSYNTGIGYFAGYHLTTGDYNIDIGNQGVAGEGKTIRIGDSNQTRAFVAGIRGVTTVNPDAIPVVIDSAGQLGTVSSSIRFKQDVADMGGASSRLMELRPVTFHYKTQPGGPLQYGLIAEEVEQVMPELVVRDATGQLESVAYHELPAMLLNELQKQQAQIQQQQAQFADLSKTIQAQQAQIEELRHQVQGLPEARRATGTAEAARP